MEWAMYLVFDLMYKVIALARYLCISVRLIIYHIEIISFLFLKAMKIPLIFDWSSLQTWSSLPSHILYSGGSSDQQFGSVCNFMLQWCSSWSSFCSYLLEHFISISFWSRFFLMWFSTFLLFTEIWLCLGTSSGLCCQDPDLLLAVVSRFLATP